MRPSSAAFVTALTLATPSVALANEPAQNTERVAEAAPSTDAQNWTASAGAVINTGNTRSYSFNGGTNFSITRGSNGFSFESIGNFGRAVPAGGNDFETNARNVQSKARFDHFFSPRHAAFLSSAHRWDTFAGLDTRLQAQVGYQYNFIRESNHRLWTELGYDFTFDNVVQSGDPLTPGDDTLTYHSVRGFLGWENRLNEHVTYKTGLEALFNVQQTEDWRLNWENTINATLTGRLQLELKFNVLFDHEPVPGKRPTDTRTTVNLVLDMW